MFLFFLIVNLAHTITALHGSLSNERLFEHAFKNYCLFNEKETPEEIAKLKKAYTIIKTLDKEHCKESPDEQSSNTDVDIDEKTFEELRLINAQSGAPFIKSLNPKTSFGLVHLIKMLSNPTTDRKVLVKRQKQLQFLIENPEIIKKLEKIIGNLNDHHFDVIETKKPLNLSPVWALKNTLMSIKFFYSWKNSLICLIKYLNITADQTNNQIISFVNNMPWIKTYEKSLIEECQKSFQDTTKATSLFPFYYNYILRFLNNNILDLKAELLIAVLLFYGAFLTIPLNMLIYNHLKEPFQFCKQLFIFNHWYIHQSQTSKITHSFNTIQPIVENKCSNPIMHTNQEFAFLKKYSSQLKKINYIDTTSQAIESYQSYLRKILLSLPNPYTLYQTERASDDILFKSTFEKIFYTIGYVDALCSLARLYQKHNCSFAEYVSAPSPILHITQGLHPNTLDHSLSTIKNNFSYAALDTSIPVIVSGQNGSGKSFNTKMLFLNAWLAQTLCFTLTSTPTTITPFNHFKIQANISDSDVLSKNQTERKNLATLITKLLTLENQQKKSFTLIDEAWSTTSAELGEPNLTALIETLSQTTTQSLLIVITHLHKALQLPKTRQISIAVTPQPDGTNKSTFTFQDGPSLKNDTTLHFIRMLPEAIQKIYLRSYNEHAKTQIEAKNISE